MKKELNPYADLAIRHLISLLVDFARLESPKPPPPLEVVPIRPEEEVPDREFYGEPWWRRLYLRLKGIW